MAILGFHINHLTERSGQAAARVTQYLTRTGEYAPQEIAYLTRTSADTVERGDFVAKVTGNMPAWAHDDPGTFFAAAEAYERGGSERAGRWATTWQIALPRELTREEQWEMGTAFVAHHLAQHAYLCVMHDPVTDGEHQPHLHVIFSERRHNPNVEDPQQYFRQPGRYESCPKERWFSQRGTAYSLRESWADWANYTLERLGHVERVHPRSLYARDIDRKPEPKVGYSTDPERHAARARIRAERQTALEQAKALEGWEARKARLGLGEVMAIEPATFLQESCARARQQEGGRWNPEYAALKVSRQQAYQWRMEHEAAQLCQSIADGERYLAQLAHARGRVDTLKAHEVQALLQGPEERMTQGLKAKLFEDEVPGYRH